VIAGNLFSLKTVRVSSFWLSLTAISLYRGFSERNAQPFCDESTGGTLHNTKLESSQSPHTSIKAMLFARWQHHLRFCSDFPYAPLKAMVTKISKWSRIQDSFRITSKIESLVTCAIPDIPSKFQKDPSITFWVILLTHRQTDKVRQKHYLLGGGKK